MVKNFSELREDAQQKRILDVWNKGTRVKDGDPKVWRQDYLGHPIKFADYGNRDSKYSWEMDHITPVARGGSDALSNLRPLQWEANVPRH